MPRKVVAVVGGLAHDVVLKINQQLERGTAVKTERYEEDGGRGGNIAISTFRSLHNQPLEDHGPEPRLLSEGEDGVEFRIVAAVANAEWRERFTQRLGSNGINCDGVQTKGGEQDHCTRFVEGKTGKVTQAYGYGASDGWVIGDFDTLEQIGGGVRPDLVVLTMELHISIVEHIIDIVSKAGIEIILYASPGEPLLAASYPKVSHLICNRFDAQRILGYEKLDDLDDPETWPEVVNNFYSAKGVQNVVLKAGTLGAYFKNHDEEGYASGYSKINEVADASGATAAFVGTYVAELLMQKANNDWSLGRAVDRGNMACTMVFSELGFLPSLPWCNQIDEIEADPNRQPLYPTIEDLINAPRRPGIDWKRRKHGAAGTFS